MCNTKNYAQFCNNFKGKSIWNRIHIHTHTNHFAVCLKLTQYCNNTSTFLKKQNNKTKQLHCSSVGVVNASCIGCQSQAIWWSHPSGGCHKNWDPGSLNALFQEKCWWSGFIVRVHWRKEAVEGPTASWRHGESQLAPRHRQIRPEKGSIMWSM